MKFGESLNESLVPEWREQYVDYKAGKKQIKKVTLLYEALKQQKTDDLTPLLDPLDRDTNYVNEIPEQDMGLGPTAYEGPEERSSRRRPSVFSLLVKSVKNKKEEYYEERTKFNNWLEDELVMVNHFYTEKERDIYERFLVLEEQFSLLKEHNLELARRSNKDQQSKVTTKVAVTGWAATVLRVFRPFTRYDFPSLPSTAFLDRWRAKQDKLQDVHLKTQKTDEQPEYYPNFRENQIRNGDLGYYSDDGLVSSANSDSSQFTGTILVQAPEQTSDQQLRSRRRDYQPKHHFGVPYLYAKKQLKSALIEHYRSISLLKSYSVLNRTAFRKITKKYDKAIGATVSKDFMTRIDREAYFQTSEVLDKITARIEDLFLSFFDSEKGDRKHGLEKLRSATYAYNNANIRMPLYYKAMFASGLFFGIGLPLFIIALYVALDRTITGRLPEGKFLLQLWGGFFLLNLAVTLLGINFLVLNKFKINYKFIFEFNLATALDHKQFLLLPSITFAFMGIMGWLSFQDFWPGAFPGRTFPLVYVAVCLIVILWPGPQLYPASRKWLQICLWRLLWSGFYPVEFRDFSAGDIFCSLTYPMGNISFFFCLYTRDWRHILGGGPADSDSKCGSNYSHLMGFFATLPSIWRLLQCVRRFMDSGDAFPHVPNIAKYLVGVAYYCLLSLWRIYRTQTCRALFIVFASVNSIYCAAWDVVMDWSLGQTNSKHYLLRDHLFFGYPGYYYAAIVVDIVLRFQWVFYAFFSNQIQQSAVTSFAIAVAELVRRFIWFFFRLENEHCTNVILFRASRDSPLPYLLSIKVERAIKKLVQARYDTHKFIDADFSMEAVEPSTGRTTAYSGSSKNIDSELGGSSENHLARRKTAFISFSDALNKAHIKDFQRKTQVPTMDESDDEDDDELRTSRRNSIG